MIWAFVFVHELSLQVRTHATLSTLVVAAPAGLGGGAASEMFVSARMASWPSTTTMAHRRAAQVTIVCCALGIVQHGPSCGGFLG